MAMAMELDMGSPDFEARFAALLGAKEASRIAAAHHILAPAHPAALPPTEQDHDCRKGERGSLGEVSREKQQ